MRFRQHHAERYRKTARISLASSFLASLFLGKIAPIDRSDVCGMNLWDIKHQNWSIRLLEIAGEDAYDLLAKLGDIELDGGAHLGKISSYFVRKYNFVQSLSMLYRSYNRLCRCSIYWR